MGSVPRPLRHAVARAIGSGMSTLERDCQQVATVGMTAESTMRRKDFALGVEDKRAGYPPRYDDYLFDQCDGEQVAIDQINGQWAYERGRLWASIAPRSLPLMIDGRLNPNAVRLYQLARGREYVR